MRGHAASPRHCGLALVKAREVARHQGNGVRAELRRTGPVGVTQVPAKGALASNERVRLPLPGKKCGNKHKIQGSKTAKRCRKRATIRQLSKTRPPSAWHWQRGHGCRCRGATFRQYRCREMPMPLWRNDRRSKAGSRHRHRNWVMMPTARHGQATDGHRRPYAGNVSGGMSPRDRG